MTRRYPPGWSLSLQVTIYDTGPWCRVRLLEERDASPEVLQGFLSYDALSDLEALVFALLADVRKGEEPAEPF